MCFCYIQFSSYLFIDINCSRWSAIAIMMLPLKVLFKNILDYILSIKVILESVIPVGSVI